MKRLKGLVIAIDGPVGAGKSTVAKLVAQKLGYLYVDTGAMYRAVALKALRLGMDINDPIVMAMLAEATDIQLQQQDDGSVRVFLDGEDVTEAIRTPEVSEASSIVSAHEGVRKVLAERQKAMAELGGVVMEGRDIQTVISPDAEVKIFLTASLEERAKRKWLELQQKGISVSYEEVLYEVKERDERDKSRAIAPLRKAPDAVEIDTTKMTPEEVADKIVELACKRASV
ncbi:cytidylate kinase [Candidatus Fervidibacter sacchari]|uniref:Cytidylate kinase n=1 Tax=Candidatus Fervidibacter sacchari TaxID=1448929 RepID=A0ABT2ET00_9BACT|nr:cytidylate kinase [Candidatus Fervidibacter sacchari]